MVVPRASALTGEGASSENITACGHLGCGAGLQPPLSFCSNPGPPALLPEFGSRLVPPRWGPERLENSDLQGASCGSLEKPSAPGGPGPTS